MIVNKLLLNFFVHAIEWVESSLEVTGESAASLYDLSHDFVSLGLGDSWTEWVSIKVSTNSDSGGNNHGGVLLGEFSVLNA